MSSSEHIPESEQQQARFAKAVNRQGYAFQNALLRQCVGLNESRKSSWSFEAAEFPVEVNGDGTRIDFVLWADQRPYWLLAECKRVNPALADWLFLRTSYVRRYARTEQIIAEQVAKDASGCCSADGVEIWNPHPHFVGHRGFEVRTEKEGESGSSRDAIEEAAGQVLRGLNGMVNHLTRQPTALGPGRRRILLPVIFTTANLWVSDADLSNSDVRTGRIDPKALNPLKVSYLFYQYHLSPGIKHGVGPSSIIREPFAGGLSLVLARSFIRTVAIVCADGVEDFLTQLPVDRFIPSDIQC